MSSIRELYNKLLELEKLGDQGLLKITELKEIIQQLRNLDISSIQNELVRRRFDKKQKKIDTIWETSEDLGYTSFDKLKEWKILLDEVIQSSGELLQQYFSPGSEIEILDTLKVLFSKSNIEIGIVDTYFDEKFFKLLACANSVNIKVLSKPGHFKNDYIIKAKAFNTLFSDKKLEIREFSLPLSHDRYYYIDDDVYSLGTSIQKPSKSTLFTPLNKTEAKKAQSDFKGWRDEGNIII